jgi:hypothetical protein
MYFTPETLLNHVFEVLRKPKAPNRYDVLYSSSMVLAVSKRVLFFLSTTPFVEVCKEKRTHA